MNAEIAAKFASIVAAVQDGTDFQAAFEVEFGAGSYVRLAGMIQDTLAPAPEPDDAVDCLVRTNTAFRTLGEMLEAVGYRPSCDMRVPAMVSIADAYDAAQAARGDARRAYRYGEARQVEAAKPAAVQAAPETVESRCVGRLWANQGYRDAEVLGVVDGRALVAYEMPAGRVFLWDVPASTTWRAMGGDRDGAIGIRNVSANNPPKRWAAVLAEWQAGR